MRLIKFFFNIIILALLFIFFAQNYDIFSIAIQLKVPFSTIYSPQIPLYLLLCIAFVFGVLVAGSVSIKEKIILRRELAQKNRILREKEEELVSLRTLPMDQNSHKIHTEESLL